MKSSAADFDAVFNAVAGYFAVLAEPSRLKIMHAVCEDERTVGAIVTETGISQPNVSRHLALMLQRGLVRRRREGNQIYYGIADQATPEICRAVCTRIADGMDGHGPMRRKLLRLIPPAKKRAA
jgi:DNA-binding transcriptional ArsR family regulator